MFPDHLKGGIMIPEFLYRFENHLTTMGTRLNKRTFEVIRETPCGYWIKLFRWGDDKKWVSKVTRKRFAYPSEQAAMRSFKARKRRQIEILEGQLSNARAALSLADPTGDYEPRGFGRLSNSIFE
jgi:hypothetical protein